MTNTVNLKEKIVTIKDVSIEYRMKYQTIKAVDSVSLELEKGKITAIVGESGSGKTTIASGILGAIAEPGVISEGSIIYHDQEDIDVKNLSPQDLIKYKWSKVSMVFQAAQSALNPVMTVYDQFLETALDHGFANKEEIKTKVIELLKYVKLEPERVMKAYPHQLSGGMKQRVMIAFALLLNPGLIILDEPTTALDVITQDHIFKLLKTINTELGISMLLLTHDIAIVAKYADYVGVMSQGKLVEYGTTYDVFLNPQNSYTKKLIDSTPSLTKDISLMRMLNDDLDEANSLERLERIKYENSDENSNQELMKLENIHMVFEQGSFLSKRKVHALKNVSLTIRQGEIVTLVGESGSGKTTLGKIITGLYKPTEGTIMYDNEYMNKLFSKNIHSFNSVQFVQQDSYAALNPVKTIYESLYGPLRSFDKSLTKQQANQRIEELMEMIGLSPAETFLKRYPHQLSGGQRQRVLIARALTSKPKLIVADEPVSMIDVSLRLSILNLMNKLNEKLNISFVYITHDLSTARYIANGGKICVMYQGEIVEEGPIEDIINHPKHPYTIELIKAVPNPDPSYYKKVEAYET